MNNRRIAERYGEAAMNQDLAALGDLASPDIVVSYPQSGETIRGLDNYLAMLSSYPGGLPRLEVSETHGTSETVSVVPSPVGLPVITVSGAGNTFFFEGVADYRDGGVFNIVGIVEVVDGKVAKETAYFAAPFDPPQWRSPFVEK
jgi:ketosteroid isomerase-like protein